MPSDQAVRRWPAVVASIFGATLMVVAQQAGQLAAGRNPLYFLRTQFWYDQLGYLAIAADTANGQLDQTEPVTMTGVSHYPRFYYSLVGIVARMLGTSTVTTWNLVALALQFAAAFTVGFVAVHLARRWWVGVLAPLPFLTGVFAYVHAGSENAWYSTLEAHAVLWGPFGALFSNNAEAAGLSVGIIALGCLVWAWNARIPGLARATITIVAAAAVGALSSFQTYSFLSLTYLLAFAAAVAGIVLARRRLLMLILSFALVLVVFVAGPILAGAVGQLPTLMFGMLPALPGLVVALIRSRGLVALAGIAAVAAAAPQILYTLLGMAQGDPFLSYRVASNHQLGIVSWQAVVGASVILVALTAALTVALRLKDTLSITMSATALTALPLLTVNDVWGANAEPYRFWIEGILLGGVLAMFALARVSGILFQPHADRVRSVEGPTEASKAAGVGDDEHAHDDAQAYSRTRRRLRRVLVGSLIVVGLLWTAALPDWVNSLRDPVMQAVWNPGTEREAAIGTLARRASTNPADGLVTTELCVDNRTAKVNSGAPIANYHLGMAWPAHRDAIDAIKVARDANSLDEEAMRASGTRWVITDSNCSSSWESQYAEVLNPVGSIAYNLTPGEVISAGSQGSGTITLWELVATP